MLSQFRHQLEWLNLFYPLRFKVLVLFCVFFSINSFADPNIKQSSDPMPAKVFSSEYPLNERQAYNLQRSFIQNAHKHNDKVMGYKAGLMSVSAFQALSLTSPVTGVLLESSLLTPDSAGDHTYSLNAALNLMIEQEFAFRLSRSITHAIVADDLINYIDKVSTSIELPDVSFPHKKFLGVDIIANNVLANKVVLSKWQTLTPKLFTALDQLTIHLSCHGDVVATGVGKNTLLGQKDALLWMINHLVNEGFLLNKGMVLLTGNLIPMTKAKACRYTASFSEFDDMNVTVTP